MKKRNSIIHIILLLALATIMDACFDAPGTDLLLNSDASSFVEIQEAGTSAGLSVPKLYLRKNDGIAKKDSIRVNILGPQRTAATNVTWVIDPSSTAVAGFHYTLVTSGGTVSIPAGKSFAYIKFTVNADNINGGESWKLTFKLTGGDLKVSPNYGTFSRNLGLCGYARANFTGVFDANEPGYGHYNNTFSADGANPDGVVSNNFWDFNGVVKYAFNSNIATPNVTLPSQDVTMGGVVYVVAGTATLGTYDACTYTWTIPYTVTTKSSGALQDNNVHTYTKK